MSTTKTKRYLLINKNGNFAERYKEPKDGFTRVDWVLDSTGKAGTYYEKESRDALIGIITGLKKEQTDFGARLVIRVEDENHINYIQLAFDSSYADYFLGVLPNVDLSKEVELKPYDFTDKENQKRRRGISVKQNGEKLKSFYFGGANGMPIFPAGEEKGSNKVKRWVLDKADFMESELTTRFAALIAAMEVKDEPTHVAAQATPSAPTKEAPVNTPVPAMNLSEKGFDRVDAVTAFGIDEEDPDDLPF